MPLFRTLLTIALLALAVPASAQSAEDLGHLSPPIPETPRALTPNERLCDAIDRYVRTHPDARVAVRLPERTEALNVQDRIHLEVLRYHAAATYLASMRASGRSLQPAQARAWATASRATMLMDLLRRAYRLRSTELLNIEWTLSYPATVWCQAVRAGREPNPRQAHPGSLVSRFCEYDSFELGGHGLAICRTPRGFGFGEGPRSPTVYDLRTGAVLPLLPPGTTVFGTLGSGAGRPASRGLAARRDVATGVAVAMPGALPVVGTWYDAELVNRISNPIVDPSMRLGGRLPADLSALPVVGEPLVTTP